LTGTTGRDLFALSAPGLVFPGLSDVDRQAVLRRLATGIAATLGGLADDATLVRGFAEREALGSTALGAGIAVPHCRIAGLNRPWIAIGLHPEGIEFGATDGQPVRIFFAVVSPSGSPAEHLRILASISRWARDPARVEALASARTAEEAIGTLNAGGAEG
jgi:mannitol/fructose-specific phosphotransferase system IIA component (Ntr-type)